MYSTPEYRFYKAIEYGKINIVKYMSNLKIFHDRNDAISLAARHGNLEIIKILFTNGYKYDINRNTYTIMACSIYDEMKLKSPLSEAILNDHFEIFTYLIDEKKYNITQTNYYRCLKIHNIEYIKKIYANNDYNQLKEWYNNKHMYYPIPLLSKEVSTYFKEMKYI